MSVMFFSVCLMWTKLSLGGFLPLLKIEYLKLQILLLILLIVQYQCNLVYKNV